MSEQALNGVGVLVTRPRHQSVELAAAIEAAGGTAIDFPTIKIVPRIETEIQTDLSGRMDPDITIFISRNAVEHGLAYAAGQIAAIGPATAEAIQSGGGCVDICPSSGFDSEHLLAESAFENVSGKTIRIIRGDGGRELLASRLQKRGATVDYVSTYSRALPEVEDAEIKALEKRWRNGEIAAVVVMSVQSLENLGVLLPKWCRARLKLTPLVTPSVRVLKEALRQYPGCPALLAKGPRASDVVDALANEPS
jgi:uroporphyrinogen-III synthase